MISNYLRLLADSYFHEVQMEDSLQWLVRHRFDFNQ